MYNESDNLAVGYALGRDANTNNNNGWGGDGAWWWIIILLIFGWGGFGNGFGFGNGGGALNGALTRGDLCQDMNFNNLDGAVRSLQSGLCDGFYAMNTGMLNGFAGVQQTLCQGFGGVNTAITTSGYETRGAISDLGYRLQDCCCSIRNDISSGFAATNYNAAQNTNAIVQAGNANTQKILDFLCNEKISGLQAENALLTAQLSQQAQTRTLIDTLLPVARPAYITCSPYASAFGFPYGYSNGSGCGCGTGYGI